MTKRPVTLEDFWALQNVSEAQLSPDGKTAAYVVGSYDEKTNKTASAIWLADLQTGQTRQFTSGEAADAGPRWSRDGSRLAFTSTRHEGKPQIFVISFQGGEPRRITSLQNGAHSPTWSPDGTKLCFCSDVDSDRQKVPQEDAWFESHTDADGAIPRMRRQTTLVSRFDMRGWIERRTHLFLADLDKPDEEPKQLTDGDQDDLEPAWSPKDSLIVFMSNRTQDAEHNFAADVWTVDADSGELTCLTNSNLTANSPSWSPDGDKLAFYAIPEWIKNGRGDTHVWTVSRRGGDQREVSADLDQSCGGGVQPDYMWPGLFPPAWSPDGATIYFHAIEGGDVAIFAVSAAAGEVRRVSRGQGVAAGPQCSSDGGTIVCLASTPTHPFDVFMVPASGGELQPVTNTNRDLLEGLEIVSPQHLTFKGPDNWEIEGWLIKPVEGTSKPYPMILHVHGGPHGAWGNTFYFQAQALAGAGYASLYLNPRGSVGRGDAFARAADWGEKDYEDLMAGVDAVLDQGEVDSSKLGITGISYGGFMTNWVLGHTDRFVAGVSVNGVASFFSMYGLSDVTALWFQSEMGGPYWTSPEQWEKYRFHSPISYVGNVTAPLLLLQSENDYRCPIPEGEQMLTALRVQHKTVELIRIPGASHVTVLTGTPHQRYFQWKLTKDWFDTYVRGEKVQPAAPSEEEAGVTVETVPV